jgi:hypothetical protein
MQYRESAAKVVGREKERRAPVKWRKEEYRILSARYMPYNSLKDNFVESG